MKHNDSAIRAYTPSSSTSTLLSSASEMHVVSAGHLAWDSQGTRRGGVCGDGSVFRSKISRSRSLWAITVATFGWHWYGQRRILFVTIVYRTVKATDSSRAGSRYLEAAFIHVGLMVRRLSLENSMTMSNLVNTDISAMESFQCHDCWRLARNSIGISC